MGLPGEITSLGCFSCGSRASRYDLDTRVAVVVDGNGRLGNGCCGRGGGLDISPAIETGGFRLTRGS